MRFKMEKGGLKNCLLRIELRTRTVTQAVGVNILLSLNSTFGAEFLPFESDKALNFSSTIFTFFHFFHLKSSN